MAYPTVDKPYGLKPVNLIGGQVFAGATRQMEIASGYATSIFYGDLVKRISDGTIEKDTGTTTATPCGVFLGVSFTNSSTGQVQQQQFYPASQSIKSGTKIFAVVADEVQRLAERSASATKQIETLVKTIQTDTNEAVISMEQTTTEVVRGANLAKDAGIALDEIQKVSGDLANLMANISDAAKLQSASASHIATTMTVVQEITSQTTTATFDTARSVSELANMAESLRESVTDFKLPD
mgnify:CR=1 FL=1